MSAIGIIYKRELATYFRAPLGWVVGFLLLFIAGLLFQTLALGGKEKLSADVLRMFFWLTSYTTMVLGVVLSIRLLAEERQQQTIVLLNTSPVRDTEIVLGKFLAAFTFLCFLTVLSIYMPLLIKVRGKITFGEVAVGYLGLFLLGGTTLAIGMFASALTKSQLIAAAVALTITVLLFLLFQLAKIVGPPLNTVATDLALWSDRFHKSFEMGILKLKDVVYYVGVTYFFLLLAIKTLEAKRWH